MKPRTRLGWTSTIAALVLASLLLVGLGAATAWTSYWVDAVPGGDAGLATSPELEAGRRAMALFGLALLLLGAISGFAVHRRARRGGRRELPPDPPARS